MEDDVNGGRSGGFLFFLAIMIAGAVLLSRSSLLDSKAPDFSLPATYGSAETLESYRGRPLLLVFWTTSCGICRQEMPVVNEMVPTLRNSGIQVLAIHLGEAGDIEPYLQANGINVKSLLDADGTVGRSYGVSGVPKLVLIGSDGKIRRTHLGFADRRLLQEWINVVSSS